MLLGTAAVPSLAQTPAAQVVEITGVKEQAPFGQRASPVQLQRGRAASSDTARLLQDLLGISLQGAGGLSSLPALNGLGGDRVRTQVDGMDLVAACPNHMNSPLSYMDPSQVESVRVFAGIAPVSIGGDSLGGTIQVESAPAVFATSGETRLRGQLGGFVRGAGNGRGGSASASIASEQISLAYIGSTTRRENISAARAFKPAAPGTEGGPEIPGEVIASSAYDARNDAVALAFRHAEHQLQLRVSRQDIGFEGFPNQRMDMTANRSTQLNLRYTGRYDGVAVLARAYQQTVDHAMDMGPDRYRYGFGMPMLTEATTRGGLLQATIDLSATDVLRLGIEGQTHVLYDWWPAVGGAMGPNAFWNIDHGRRDKAGAFAEWDAFHGEHWFTQLGLRTDRVVTDAGPVQGYDNGLGAIWGNEAAAFNALQRRRSDLNVDAVAVARYTPAAGASYELGLARKSRAPNLYQRYPWSTQPMAALMNNVAGDGNGYIGSPDLRPEVAHTAAVSAHWHDGEQRAWSLRSTATLTRVHDHIDARRCDFGQCSADNLTRTDGFVLLQYVNQKAQIESLDVAGELLLAESPTLGRLSGTLVLKALRGRNRSTGDGLHNIMPLNATLALEQRAGRIDSAVELVAVTAKERVSQVRNEVPTPGYALVNLRAGVAWDSVRLELGIENLFDRFYAPPLGGAYLGQGRSMTSAGIPWGVTVPGPGRSAHAALNLSF